MRPSPARPRGRARRLRRGYCALRSAFCMVRVPMRMDLQMGWYCLTSSVKTLSLLLFFVCENSIVSNGAAKAYRADVAPWQLCRIR